VEKGVWFVEPKKTECHDRHSYCIEPKKEISLVEQGGTKQWLYSFLVDEKRENGIELIFSLLVD
jgi:hypothetical protein